MQKKQKAVALATMAMAVVMLSGCGCTEWANKKIGEKIVEKGLEAQMGGKVDINSSKGESTLKTEDGAITFSETGAALPENFPKDVFVYDDAKIAMAITGTADEKSYSISYTTKASEIDAFTKYKQEMEKNGWKKESEADMGEGGKMLNYTKNKSKVMILMGADRNDSSEVRTSIAVTVSVDKSSSVDLENVGGGMQE